MKPIKTLEEICKGQTFVRTEDYREYCNLRFNDDRLQTPYCMYRAKVESNNGKYLCHYQDLDYYFKLQEKEK